MKKSNLSLILATASALVLASCGHGNVIESGSGNQSTDKIFDTTTLKDDLVLDENGKVVFEDEVNLKVWSIIGDPDQVVFRKMIDDFNQQYLGRIHLDVVYQGHFDYYNALDSTYSTDFEASFPDVCFMHNDKIVEYAYKEYFYPMDELIEKTGVEFDFTQAYSNINRTTIYKDHRFGIPVDAHGWVTQFRQDIIKKNGLGFENNTRFIPECRSEYQQLLEGLRAKADKNELLIRNINAGADHSWRTANPDKFYPSFPQSTDPDGLSALYVNGGRLANDTQDKVTFQENLGFQTYLTDHVERYNNRLVGESGTNAEMFGKGDTVMFPEGPWWVSQQFSIAWNNSELKKAANGVSKEDAEDPIYNTPYNSSHPIGWWTLDENDTPDNHAKWYGNGHAIATTRHITSMQKMAAALTFAQWYTQGKNTNNEYNLVKWNASGHVPAWKNVYESNEYKTELSNNMTLRALGNPADIIAMEGLEYSTTLFNGVGGSCANVIAALQSKDGCDKAKALKILNETYESTQASLDLLRLGL